MLGIEKSFEVIEVKEEEKIVVTLKSKIKKYRCPTCNQYTSSVHDRLKPIKIKYLKLAERGTELLLIKRRFICHKCKIKFTEEMNLNGKKSEISNKLKIKIRKELMDYNLSLTWIAKTNGVSDMTVRRELLEATSTYPNRLRLLPSMISFDEFKADTNEGKYAFVINDLLHKKTLDILPSRKKEDLTNYFTGVENRSSVQYIVSDMYEPYLLVQQIMFPKALFCADRFHYTRHVMDAVDKIRKRLQEEFGYKSKEYNLLKNKKNVSLLRKYSNDINWYVWTKRYKNGRMIDIMPITIREELFSLSSDLKEGYYLKELFLDIVRHGTYENAERQFLVWIKFCKESKIEEFIVASNTISNWLPYIVNSFIERRLSQGFTEGRNNKIKVIKRIGYGFKNFKFFRLRLLYIFNGKLGGGNRVSK